MLHLSGFSRETEPGGDQVMVPRRGGAGGSQETVGSLWGDLGLDIMAA